MVLRRGRRHIDQIAIAWVLHQRAGEEARRAAHDGIDALEVSPVLRVAVVVVEMLAEPSRARIRRAPAGMLARGGELPEVAEDMRHPALGIVEGLGRSLSRAYLGGDPVGERTDGLPKVALLARPVVHL